MNPAMVGFLGKQVLGRYHMTLHFFARHFIWVFLEIGHIDVEIGLGKPQFSITTSSPSVRMVPTPKWNIYVQNKRAHETNIIHCIVLEPGHFVTPMNYKLCSYLCRCQSIKY